jgi:hypothetical protein
MKESHTSITVPLHLQRILEKEAHSHHMPIGKFIEVLLLKTHELGNLVNINIENASMMKQHIGKVQIDKEVGGLRASIPNWAIRSLSTR